MPVASAHDPFPAIRTLTVGDLDRLIDALRADGATVIAPRVVDGALVFAPTERVAELPAGLVATQEPGRSARAAPPTALRRGPRRRVAQALDLPAAASGLPRAAPSAHLRAPLRHSKTAAARAARRARLRRRRARRARPGAARRHLGRIPITPRAGTTSSSSRSTVPSPAAPASAPRWRRAGGPRDGFDLALTELLDGRDTGSSSESGSLAGESVLARLELPTAPTRRSRPGRRPVARGARRRCLAGSTLPRHPRPLAEAVEHPHWRRVAERCLGCGNCTLVCPTCFCHSFADSSIWPARLPNATANGTAASISSTRDCTRTSCALAGLPLPAVADPQAVDLGRAIRQLGMRRLRPLHHLVPGGDRSHRRGRGPAPSAGSGRAAADAPRSPS